MTLTNNGHTVKMSLSGDYLVDGGGLGATYRAGQFHFHWGKNNDRGSEHFMDFTPHPAEMHIVTYDTSRFGSIAEAVGEDGGLAVLGFLIEVSSSVQISPPINIESLLPASRSNFFRYDGSLTTPPCSEGVIWTNFKDTIHMSENQLKMFRDLRDESRHKIVDNFRPLEPLHGRTLYSNSC
ncbi:carbonic anhydrase 7-like [Saccoglossus kowalevskii]